MTGTLVAGVSFYLGSNAAQHATTTSLTAVILPFTHDERAIMDLEKQPESATRRAAWHRVGGCCSGAAIFPRASVVVIHLTFLAREDLKRGERDVRSRRLAGHCHPSEHLKKGCRVQHWLAECYATP